MSTFNQITTFNCSSVDHVQSNVTVTRLTGWMGIVIGCGSKEGLEEYSEETEESRKNKLYEGMQFLARVCLC